jgi:pyrimidine-nucleoside phosphorylase
MTIIDIIGKKRDNKELSLDEINFWIENMIAGKIEDYQISSLLMAIVLNGMTFDETFYLTDAMVRSGDVVDLSNIEGIKVDKHSTGGVGDKLTLILAPLFASFGIKVAKMSGRGLGHTGGTLDKLESIPGYKVELTNEEFISQVNDIGLAVIGQSGNLVPADKKLYALRDVTGTVDSIPLIASSIMSKKIASGADYIFIDLKVGNGALMKNLDEAKELARTMIEIGNRCNKKAVCILTNMDEPLGYAIGNSLEVQESIDTLKGMGPVDVLELVIKISGLVLSTAENIEIEEAERLCFKKINTGEAYTKFEEMVKYQGGDLSKMQISDRVISIRSPKSGYINSIDTLELGEVARKIGAGRLTKDDAIDHKVGIVLNKKIGDFVEANEELARVYIDEIDVRLNDIINCYRIEEMQGPKDPLIYEIIQ